MPYGLRDQESSSFFHVFSRGADRQDIFCLDGDHAIFEDLIAEMVKRYGVEVHAFAWMSNHFHVLVHAPEGNLSEALQFLLGVYARTFNIRTRRSGPLFDRRFGSVPIIGDDRRSAETHFAVVARYIHRNPLAFVPASALAAYAHSSLGVYLGSRDAPLWMTTDLLDEMIDPSGYIEEILEVGVEDLVPVGDLPPAVTVSVDELVAVVAHVAGEHSVKDLDGRLLTMTLALELRVGELDSIADRFGVAMESVRRAARRGRVRLTEDRSFEHFRSLTLAALARDQGHASAAVRFHPEVNWTPEVNPTGVGGVAAA